MSETLGKKIKYYRKLKGYSQEKLAEKTNLSKMSIRRYESGERQPGLDALKKIASALECQVSDIDESIYIIPSYKPTTEKMKWFKLEAEAMQIYEKEQTGEALTFEERQKIIDYEKQLKSQAEQREEAAKKAPKFFAYDEKGNIIKDKKAPKFTTTSRSHAQTEAYELFHSLLSEEWVMSQEQETTAVQLKEMLGAYNQLNNAGRKEAVKRVDELTEIPRYTKPDEHLEE